MTVTQYSRSSNPSATSTATLFPSSLIASPFFWRSVCLPQEFIHRRPGLLAPHLEDAGEFGYGVCAPPGAEQELGCLEVRAVIGTGWLRCDCLPAPHERQELLAVAGGASQPDALYRAELVYALRLAGGYLLEVGVVEHHVGGDPLTPGLLSPPALEPLEERRIHAVARGVGLREVARRGRRAYLLHSDRCLSHLICLAEADVAAPAGCDLLHVAEVPEEVFAAAGGQVGVGLDVPYLGVGRRGAVLQPRCDGAATSPVERVRPEPHVHDGAARDDLGRPIYHHPVEGALRDGRPHTRAARELGQADCPAPRQRRVHGGHLLAKALPLLLQTPHLHFGPQVVAAVDQTRLLQAPQHDTGRLRVDAAEYREGARRDVGPPAVLQPRERLEEGADLLLPCGAERHQPFAPAKVRAPVEDGTLRLLAVPAGASGLLHVGGEASGGARVDHEPYVGLVHPHPEGDRGDDHGELVCHKALLHVGALRRAHPRVVGCGVDAGPAQARRQLLALLARRRVDDPRRRRLADDVEDQGQLVLLLLRGEDAVGEVRAVEARHHDLGIAHLQRADYVATDAGGGGGGEGADGWAHEVADGAG